jgi:hypothetical protein
MRKRITKAKRELGKIKKKIEKLAQKLQTEESSPTPGLTGVMLQRLEVLGQQLATHQAKGAKEVTDAEELLATLETQLKLEHSGTPSGTG